MNKKKIVMPEQIYVKILLNALFFNLGMIIRKLIYLFLCSLIPLSAIPANALEEQLLDYSEISQPQCRQAIQDVERKLNTYNVTLITIPSPN